MCCRSLSKVWKTRGGYGSGGRAVRPLKSGLEVRSLIPPAHLSKCPWSKTLNPKLHPMCRSATCVEALSPFCDLKFCCWNSGFLMFFFVGEKTTWNDILIDSNTIACLGNFSSKNVEHSFTRVSPTWRCHLGFWEILMEIFHIFLMFYRLNEQLINKKVICRLKIR